MWQNYVLRRHIIVQHFVTNYLTQLLLLPLCSPYNKGIRKYSTGVGFSIFLFFYQTPTIYIYDFNLCSQIFSIVIEFFKIRSSIYCIIYHFEDTECISFCICLIHGNKTFILFFFYLLIYKNNSYTHNHQPDNW